MYKQFHFKCYRLKVIIRNKYKQKKVSVNKFTLKRYTDSISLAGFFQFIIINFIKRI